MPVWDAVLVNRVRAEVPRYEGAPTPHILNMLNLLERGDLPTLQIARNQMEDAIMATVHQYAKMRNAEESREAEKKQKRSKFLKSD